MNLVLKQIRISSIAKDSSAAFYAADSGIECALFWDLKNNSFATSTPANPIACGGNPSISINKFLGPLQAGTTTFAFIFSGVSEKYCVQIAVGKSYSPTSPKALKTNIESRGYNTGSVSNFACTSSSARRVERAIVVNY